MGKNSAALVDAIVDPDHPVFEYTLTTRKGGETALAQRFNSFGLTWKCPEEFSHRMHFWKLQRSFDGMRLSCKMRVACFKYGGGFHGSIDESNLLDWRSQYMDRIFTMHERLTVDTTKPEDDFIYWAETWVKVKTDIIGYFWKDPNEKEIEVALYELFAKQQFPKGTSLNKGATYLVKWFNEAVSLLKNHGSEKLHDIALLVSLFRDALAEKGQYGVQLERIFHRKLQSVVEDPQRNLPPMHKLSDSEVEDLAGRSTTRLPEQVYRTLLDYMDQ